MSPENRAGSLYPPGYAFVVQLRADVSVERDQIGGRVEHVVSGGVEHFSSWEKVLAFMVRIINEMDDDGTHHRPQ